MRGTFSPDDSVARTSWSVKTLQEHTIIAGKVLGEKGLGKEVLGKEVLGKKVLAEKVPVKIDPD